MFKYLSTVLTCLVLSLTVNAEELLEVSGVKGGLIIQLGCGNIEQLKSLHGSDAYLVQGLDGDRQNVVSARDDLIKRGLHGRITAEHWTNKTLPYNDNLVNLVVVNDPELVSGKEINRVLAPRGVVLVKADSPGPESLKSLNLKPSSLDGWLLYQKPVPEDIDEWTHFLRDASNNAVAKDTRIGPPKHLQWKSGPMFTRDHDALASVSAVTTSNGRLFYILDEGETSLIHRPSKWKLIARDAFNGKLLWKRNIPKWITQLANFRAGPAQMPRRLVSVGDRVFVTLGLDAPVEMLDAVTGKTLHTFKGSEKTEEILVQDNVLLTVSGDPDILTDASSEVVGFWQIEAKKVKPVKRKVIAYDITSGKELWKSADDKTTGYIGLSLTADKDKVFYLDGQQLQCRALNSGKKLWNSDFPFSGAFLLNYTPTVVAYDDVILCLTYKQLCAFSITDGRKLWEAKGAVGFGAAGDLFVIDGMVWTIPMTRFGANTVWKRTDFLGDGGKEFWGIDLHTGEVKKRIKRNILPGVHHHRCYRNKASENFLIYGQGGLEFMDLHGNNHKGNLWTRGICQYGIMPANGYIYIPPHPCQCFSQDMLFGFYALSASSSTKDIVLKPELQKGPAYSTTPGENNDVKRPSLDAGMIWQPPVKLGKADEWPMYRGDLTRSSSSTTTISGSLQEAWQTKLGKDLTAAVVADNRMFICSKAEQVLYCLDATSGKVLWQLATPGKVDSPPAIVNGQCVFGSVDGNVYCLRAQDGALRWKFSIGKDKRRTLVDDKLESIWPIHGSVLVQDNTVYFTAGRSTHLDGGIRVYAVDLATGNLKKQITLDAEAKGAHKALLNMDLLVSDGKMINMGLAQFDGDLTIQKTAKLNTLICDTGFLGDAWFHRENWVLGNVEDEASTTNRIKMQVQGKTGKDSLGKLLAFNDKTVYGIKNPYSYQKYAKEIKIPTHIGHGHQKYSRYDAKWFPVGSRIFASKNAGKRKAKKSKKPANSKKPPRRRYRGYPSSQHARRETWGVDMPYQPRTIVLAGDSIILAGWLDAVAIQPKTGLPLNPENPDTKESLLRILSTKDGKILNEYKIPCEPVYDGMAVAYGKIYLPLKDGTVICFKEK